MEIIGYARVSTREQNLDLQLDALKEAGCKLIFEEKVSGVKDRPELDKALAYLREGDTFVIWKLDRLGRSLKDLVYIVDCLQKRKIAFKSIVDGIDTNSALGRCQFGIFASLAEYEREIIVERTRAGLQAAKERGKLTGRPIGLSEDAKRKAIAGRYKEIGKNIRPLVLIQFPNGQPETIAAVEQKLESMGYTYRLHTAAPRCCSTTSWTC